MWSGRDAFLSNVVYADSLLNNTHGGNRGKGFLGFNTTQFKIKWKMDSLVNEGL